MKVFHRCLAIVALAFLVSGFAVDVYGQSDARFIWKGAIRKCARSDKDGRNALNDKQVFLGVGNLTNPGTIVRVFPEGSFDASRRFSTFTPDTRDSLIMKNAEFGCVGETSSRVKVSPTVGIQAVIPVTGELGVESKKAKKISFSAQRLRWDNILVGEFEDMLRTFAGAQAAKNDLIDTRGGVRNFILTKALLVKGFSVVLEFEEQVGGTVQARFPTQALSIPIPGQANVGLNLQWEGNTKLTITSDSEFYIAGDIRRYDGNASRITREVKRSELFGLSLKQLRYRFSS